MNSDLIKKALKAIADGDAEAAQAILTEMIAEEAGAGGGDDGAAMADDDDDDPPAAMADGDEDDEELGALAEGDEDDGEPAAMARLAMQLTGKKTPGAAIAELERRSKVAADLEKREAQLARDRRALEASERDDLVAQMVTLEKESPATAWADPLVAKDRDKRKPAEPWASMPLEQLRARVERLGGQPSTRSQSTPRPPAQRSDGDTPRLPVEQKQAMDIRMGLVSHKRATVREGSITRFGVLQPETGKEAS